MYPTNVKEAVELWDKGETIWSIEMGGLGPGYEQAIQLLMVEILRDHCNDIIPTDKKEHEDWLKTFGEKTVHRINETAGGYSGAQVGAVKNLAYQFLVNGWGKIMAMKDLKDRKIQVSNFWPKATKEAK